VSEELANKHIEDAESILDARLALASEDELAYYRLGKLRGQGDSFALALSILTGGGGVRDVMSAIVDAMQADRALEDMG